MGKLIWLAAGIIAASVFVVGPAGAEGQGDRAATFDSSRCFNRCVAYRGLRPASTRIPYCSRRCMRVRET
jgi:hypothetical protein